MLPIRVFLFTIFFTTPSLAFDVISEQEYKGNVDNSREFKNLQQRSQIASACICGFTSFECCGRKRALTKPGFTSLESFDDIHTQKGVKNARRVREFDNRQRPSKMSSACLCGVTSFKCCGKKRMLTKVKHV
ncbi:hypothetical protein OS493_000296 [Desmophyllum pertusum]|uniref:Uncharacterized protein n=1 Tax=Desmophyllum pertusum TaxID=174260 RepID=A0A9X0DDY3_9CNID|nr:hypothetical protein OS493_000296 [Desmophyllum pertusum]